ncbi:F-box domain-containing protein [Artemisia annua]|uniref:F-box domain-containing protein n=1 Tax=Artemisia annua TaxID=35608 RepID=A0A2U1L3K4_ARTAN|nr:F-box domain-containing protein [Artemisia annua]
MVELASLSRTTIVPKQWFEHMYDPSHFAIIRYESTSIKFLQTPCYPKPQHIVSFNMLEPKQGSTNVLEVKKDPLLEFKCMKSSEKSLGAIVRGSCNGLVYLTQGHVSDTISLVVINPLRKESYELPSMNLDLHSPRLESCGLGFDASTNTFKMVCVLRKKQVDLCEKVEDSLCTMVHVLGTDTWREIPQVPPCPIVDKCIYANGCLHWFANDYENRSKSKATNEGRKVVYFDVKNEEFGSINPPKKIGGGWIGDTQLVDLNGEVGYICNYIINNGIDVSVLKQKEWTRLFRFDQGPCYLGITKILGRLNEDEYILVKTTCGGDRLIVLNLKNGLVLYDVNVVGHEDTYKEYVYMFSAASDRDTKQRACSINS